MRIAAQIAVDAQVFALLFQDRVRVGQHVAQAVEVVRACARGDFIDQWGFGLFGLGKRDELSRRNVDSSGHF
jgi:hypothetical protein